MKKIVLLLLFGIHISTAFSQSGNTISWQASKIKIDGKIADWGGKPRFYDSKTKLAFDMRNDSNSLYLVLQSADQLTEYKFGLSGMNLWLTTQMKPSRKAKIAFSPFLSEVTEKEHKRQDELSGQTSLKQKYLISSPEVIASGFAFSDGIISSSSANNTIIYSVGWDSLGIMSIELKIPLRDLFGEPFDLNAISQKELSLKVLENAPDNPGLVAAASSTGSGNHGGQGTMSGIDNPLSGPGNGNMNQNQGIVQPGTIQPETSNPGETQDESAQMFSHSELYDIQIMKQSFRLNAKGK